MSSHHFVRDQQESALLIINDAAMSDDILGQLLEWSPAIFVLDTSLTSFVQRQIKTDFIFRTSLDAELIDSLVHSHQPGLIENCTGLDQMIDHIKTKGFPGVNVIGALRSSYPSKQYPAFDIVFYTENYRIYPFKNDFNKWMSKGSKLEIITAKKLEYKGLNSLEKNSFEAMEDGVVGILKPDDYSFILEYYE